MPVDNLTFAELRRLMLGDRQFWASNLKVTLLVRAPGARERDVVLKTIYQMSEAQFRQYWIAKVFRAEAAAVRGSCTRTRLRRSLHQHSGRGRVCGRHPGTEGFEGTENQWSASRRQGLSFAMMETLMYRAG